MSVLQPISYGLVHQVGPGTGARGFGSYKADNTMLIRPYQQESSSPIGRGYPMGIVSGAPTVYDPRAGIQEDPIVTLLKRLLGQKPVVQKAPDAGFRSNEQVYPTSGQALELPGRTLGAAPADRGLGGGGGGDVVVDASTDYGSSLNKFKSELGRLSAPSEYHSIVGGWLDNLPILLNNGGFEGREIGVQTDRNNFDVLIDELDFLQGVYEKVLRANEGEIKRYRSANEYYAAMAESAGVARYETVLNVLNSHGVEGALELKQDILAEFNKLVREKVMEVTTKEVRDSSTQLTLDSKNLYPYSSSGMRGMGKKYRDLRINTSVPRAARDRYGGDQFLPSERTQKVESGRSMNESIPLRRRKR